MAEETMAEAMAEDTKLKTHTRVQRSLLKKDRSSSWLANVDRAPSLAHWHLLLLVSLAGLKGTVDHGAYPQILLCYARRLQVIQL